MRGVTLLEVIISFLMLSVMFTAVVALYLMGTRVSSKGHAQAELLQELCTAAHRLQVDVQQSAYEGLSVGPATLCCLSPTDDQGEVAVDGAGLPLWRRYLLYYYDAPAHQLRRVAVPRPGPPAPPAPLAGFLGLRAGGTITARFIYSFDVSMPAPPLVEVTLAAEKERYGKSTPERSLHVFSIKVKN